jgi:uncharacterized protein (DUF779 family)
MTGRQVPERRVPKVRATDAARDAVRRLVAAHGPVMFVQSAGCCDGSAPMCFADGEFLTGAGDVHLGDVEGCPVYIEQRQLAAWPHPDLLLDVEAGYSDGLSLDAGDGLHFVTRYETKDK